MHKDQYTQETEGLMITAGTPPTQDITINMIIVGTITNMVIKDIIEIKNKTNDLKENPAMVFSFLFTFPFC